MFGLATYTNDAQTAATSHKDLTVVEAKENGDGQRPQHEDSTFSFSLSGGPLTGNLSVYLLPVRSGVVNSGAIAQNIETKVLSNISASHYTTLGSFRLGQYTDESVLLTEENISDDLKAGGFKVGDRAHMTVIKKPADTIKFYIHPSVKNPEGSTLRLEDISEDYSFGNGVSCCGFSLRDGTDIGAVIVVVDQAFDSIVMEKFPSMKALDK